MFGAKNGYSMTITKSKPNTVYLICDQGESYWNYQNYTDKTYFRSTSSRIIKCPFTLHDALHDQK
ncbi:11640_t:CDS:1, partial [Gigaspora margarita]